MTTFTDHQTAFIYAATDTDPPEPVTIPLANVRVWRPIGDRSPTLAAAGWYELLYVEGFPSRPARALVTVDQLAAVLGWFAGYEHNRPIADAFEHRPFGADRASAPGTPTAPAIPPPAAPLTPYGRTKLWREQNREQYLALHREASRRRRLKIKQAKELEQARLDAGVAQAQVEALAAQRVRGGPGYVAAMSALTAQQNTARRAAEAAADRVRALEAAA
jgi:hypothetical protein